MDAKSVFTREDILDALPHREPFLFVDRIVRFVPDRRIETERTICGDEPYLRGHFPDKPIMPGVLVTDALAQTSGLLWGLSRKVRDGDDGVRRVFMLAAANMKYVNPSYPGETLVMTAVTERSYGSFFTYATEARCGRRCIAKGVLTLAMVEGAL